MIIMVLLFFIAGIGLGSFFYAPKASNQLIYAGIAIFPALTLLLKARIKTKKN